MIQGFAFPVSNFDMGKSSTTPKPNSNNSKNSFNTILESSNSALNRPTERSVSNTFKENDFIAKQNDALRRTIEIKHEEPSKQSQTTAKPKEDILTPKEQTVKKVMDNLESIVAVLQNVVAINDMDLNNIDLENLNLEVSVEELEHLKVSLESLAETLDMSEAKEQLTMMIESLDQIILSAVENGEIQVEALDFASELSEMMNLVDTELKSSGTLESTELKTHMTDLVDALEALDGKLIEADSEITKDMVEIDVLKGNIVEVVDTLKALNAKINQKVETNTEKAQLEDISVKLEELVSNLKAQNSTSDSDETTELRTALTEVVEVMESLNAKVNNKLNTEDNISGKLAKLSSAFLTEDIDITTLDTDLSDESLKITIVTQNNEAVSLFNSAKGTDNKTIEVLDEAQPTVEGIPTELLSPLENQVKAQNPTSVNMEKSTEVLNSQQFMDIDKSDVMKQITSKIKTDYENELNEIKLRLTPEHLGELTIKISLERGILSARALVENTNIKQLLEANMSDLKENLKEQGIKFESIDVSVGKDSEFEEKTPNFFMNQQMNRKQNRRLKSTIDNPVSENYYGELDEKNVSQSLAVGESSMDITI